MSLNGALAGLVAITSPCATVLPSSAVIIGAIAGVLVVFSVVFFERRGIDDPVGAISVHGVNGAWGTIAAALFHMEGFSIKVLGVQALGVVSCFVWTFVTALILFWVIKKTMGLRVTAQEEAEGLDLGEHGANAYPDFAVSAYAQK